MLQYTKSSRYDAQYDYDGQYAVDPYTVVEDCVTDGMIDILKKVSSELDLDFKNFGWSVLQTVDYRDICADVCQFILDELESREGI